MDNIKKKSMLAKISRAMILVALITLIIVSIVFGGLIYTMRNDMIESNGQMGTMTESLSSESMTAQITEHILDVAENKADLADSTFSEFREDVEVLAAAAQMVYENAGEYHGRYIPLPDAAKDGELSMQLLYSEKADTSSEAIIVETGLLGNLQDLLMSINQNNENMVSDYIASETGIMLQADYISGKKFDADGNIMPYEAAERPWYKGAKSTGKPFYTPVSQDAHTSRIGIMCGVPIYVGDDLKGVAGAGMYLDNVGDLVRSIDVGETGDACIINQDGQIIFSTRTEGSLVPMVGGPDIRESDNAELAALAKNATDGKKGVELLQIDSKDYYMAYAPMETIGWSFAIILAKEEVDAPTKELIDNINVLTGEAIDKTDKRIQNVFIILLILVLLACVLVTFVSKRMSQLIVKPIKKLTESVRNVEGDNLDFEWSENTGDETEVLALSFKSLTERIKNYIDEVQSITAEKERIGAELNVATQIQANMLPCIFPAFPDRTEFDIYASMTPAKEVGGDFYDFFFVDEDHLALVMADVSGKGVPAALFMVIAKTLIKNRALMGGSPAEVLSYANDQLCEGNDAQLFVTVWMAIIELSTGKGLAANAGHEHPAIKRAGGEWELVTYRHSPAVATMEGMVFKEHEFELNPGDRLYVYTDGVAEATDAHDELYGTERMLNALNREAEASPEVLLKNVKADIDEFVGDADQFDDITMLGLYYFGKGGK